MLKSRVAEELERIMTEIMEGDKGLDWKLKGCYGCEVKSEFPQSFRNGNESLDLASR